MPIEKDRVVLDTNLWISFLLTKDYLILDQLFKDKSIVLLFSLELLEEFIEVTSRPKFKKYFSDSDISDLVSQINSHAEFIEVSSDLKICRDEKDNFLLNLAADGRATHLVTGDKDLLILKDIGNTAILTMTSYLAERSGSRP